MGQNVKCYLQAGQILQARKHSVYIIYMYIYNIHVYIIYMFIYTNISFIMWLMRRLAGKHCTIKIQHRNMLEKSPQVIIYVYTTIYIYIYIYIYMCAVGANDSAACSSIAGRFAKFCIIKCNEANLHNPESY